MCSVRGSVCVYSVVCVTVVCSDKHCIAVCYSRINYLFNKTVNCSYSLGNCLIDTGVAYHVAVCKVKDYKILFLCIKNLDKLRSNLWSAHLRFKVICSHFWRVYKHAVLVLKCSLASAREEECNVSVFLSLSNSQLVLASVCNNLTKSKLYVLLVKQDVYACELVIIWSKTAVVQRKGLHAHLRHILLCKYAGNLTCTVVTEVEEDNCVICSNICSSLNLDRFDELIGNTSLVRSLNCSNRRRYNLTLTVYHKIVSHFHAVPSLVAVHSVETANYRSNLACRFCHMSLKLLYKAFSALRVGITAIHEAVYVNFVKTVLFSHIQECKKLLN